MKCLTCGEERETEFYTTNKSRCKTCLKASAGQWQQNYPDRVKVIAKRKRERHRQHQAEYYRKWYAENGRQRSDDYKDVIVLWQKNNIEAVTARSKIMYAVQVGLLVKPEKCVLCGRKGRINGHHQDYDLPYAVMWVCSSCHKKIHSKDLTKEIERHII